MRFLAIGVTVSLAIAGFAATPAHAAEPPTDVVAAAISHLDERALAEGLADEGIALDGVEVVGQVVTIEGSVADASSGSAAVGATETSIRFDGETAEATLAADTVEGSRLELDIDVHELTEDTLSFTATDPATGRSERYDSASGTYSLVPLILGIPLAISLLQALVGASAVVVVAGITYVAVAEAVAAIKRSGSSYQHFRALRRAGNLAIGNGLSFTNAITHLRGGGDTWSRTEGGAYAVARGVKNARPEGAEKDDKGSGKHCHYHPANRTPASHAFFGMANGKC